MKGWITLYSDADWENYGGKWAKRGPDGAWYILDFTNMYEAVGERECKANNVPQYSCGVIYLLLDRVADQEKVRALLSGGDTDLVERYDTNNAWDYRGQRPRPNINERLLIERLTGYGVGGTLETFNGNIAPKALLRNAKQYAENIMKDEDKLEERLDRQVNRVGNSARDFAEGRIGLLCLNERDSE